MYYPFEIESLFDSHNKITQNLRYNTIKSKRFYIYVFNSTFSPILISSCVCVCMFVVPSRTHSLPHSIFVYIPRVLFVQLPPFREGFSSVPYNVFCPFVCLFECLCCMSSTRLVLARLLGRTE